jgi:hypothetical protein
VHRRSEGRADHYSEIDTDASPDSSTVAVTVADFDTRAVSYAPTSSHTDSLTYAVAFTGGITDTGSNAEIFSGPESIARRLIHVNVGNARLPVDPTGSFGGGARELKNNRYRSDFVRAGSCVRWFTCSTHRDPGEDTEENCAHRRARSRLTRYSSASEIAFKCSIGHHACLPGGPDS